MTASAVIKTAIKFPIVLSVAMLHFLLPGEVVANSSAIPPVEREFRGAWVASVSNINWPSKPGLPVEQQQAELIAILDAAAKLRMNAIVLQVRPACDALYASKFEPWSEYLTGAMGRAPSPFYDPLKFAVEEAHKRGLELHAWINPYRARHPSGKSRISDDHISKTHPELVRTYGKHLWLDPSEPGVQQRSLDVILDIVRRYDVDGIHMDDYFYPYKERDAQQQIIDFPDQKNWEKYQAAGGMLSRDNWRREQVNMFIKRSYAEVKALKPWVKFGISPFGIWQPGHPPQIKGLNAHEQLYADAKKWFEEGWLDYFAPQLYWPTTSQDQNYNALLKWWSEQNREGRHLWPGINTSAVGKWGAEEIVKQIEISRSMPGSDGLIHWNVASLARNTAGLSDTLSNGLYAQPALVPASPWLNNSVPRKPSLSVRQQNDAMKLSWRPALRTTTGQWVVQTQTDGKWATLILPAATNSLSIKSNDGVPQTIVLRAVTRYGIESEPAVWRANHRAAR